MTHLPWAPLTYHSLHPLWDIIVVITIRSQAVRQRLPVAPPRGTELQVGSQRATATLIPVQNETTSAGRFSLTLNTKASLRTIIRGACRNLNP